MTAQIIMFIPRPNHNRETDFPAIPYVVRETLSQFAKSGEPVADHRDIPEPAEIA